LYGELKDKLPQVGAEMAGIEFSEFQDDGAKYRAKRPGPVIRLFTLLE